jgi:hypothetical protein
VFLAVVYYCFSSRAGNLSSFLSREDICFCRALISGFYYGFKRILLLVRSMLVLAMFIIASVKASAMSSISGA